MKIGIKNSLNESKVKKVLNEVSHCKIKEQKDIVVGVAHKKR